MKLCSLFQAVSLLFTASAVLAEYAEQGDYYAQEDYYAQQGDSLYHDYHDKQEQKAQGGGGWVPLNASLFVSYIINFVH